MAGQHRAVIEFRSLPNGNPDLARALRFDRYHRMLTHLVETPSSDPAVPNTKPPRNLTPVLCQRLQREMLKACQDVAARHGLVVEAQDIIGVDLRWGFDAAFRVSIPLPDGTALDSEKLRFEALAAAFGLSAADYGRQFSTGRETFRIVGIAPRSPKYPVSAERIPDGQGFKFTSAQVALLFRKEMRDVTPKGQ